ncbi:hypothetical protein [Coraliomargarita akajimensis]|uniref:Uncharacterized protein n=1 Tax=Coraliomargarita akajimensis (strain DSM 45221 / IAM 15411 / JCM 23193 / KCTC 12865 / 04OKA010-24) TaxID=583355 RepID=D5EQT5_CORAD|nr:hypothetical protein [Coraliomargarita akajimensis]ADE53928.1 conserved hypothetical protein [Coraliomargarita akajimensis DSM 45221]
MLAPLKTLVLLVLAAVAALSALMLPAHLRTVDIRTIEWAGDQGSTSATTILESLSAAHTGPAGFLLEAMSDPSAELLAVRQQYQRLLETNPQYRVSGGPAPYFEDFLNTAHPEGYGRDNPNAILSLLLPRSERRLLVERLSQSRNSNVAALLTTRNLPGLIQLHPADHAAGAPYDAGILSIALLIQDGAFDASHALKVAQVARMASSGDMSATRLYEDFIIASLSLARRLDFRSLANLSAIAENGDDWAKMATLFRAHPDRVPLLYTVLHYSENPQQVFGYLAELPETALNDLSIAVNDGPAATQHLLNSGQAIYQSRSSLSALMERLNRYRPAFCVQLAAQQRELALALKLGMLCIAGLLFALSMGAAWRGSLPTDTATVSRRNPAVLARDAFISLVVAITLWAMVEPDVLKSQEPVTDNAPRIEFAVADSLQALKSPVKAMQDLNQVTLLVLALFFIVQLVIYCFCLIKLREIGKQNLSPAMKLRLLENEENLFDFGLYVGLGGTVLSLILVAVGVVEASLMAAYASTLFGILFTAILKVLNLRPYRRKLIIEAGEPDNAGALMKNIEL